MFIKRYLIILIVSWTIVPMSWAIDIQGLVGLVNYWEGGIGKAGFALSGFVGTEINKNVLLAPGITFFAGEEDGEDVSDLSPSLVCKFIFPFATISPFVGLEPKVRIYMEDGSNGIFFGIDGLTGLSIVLSDYLYFPIQASYGISFSNGTTLHELAFKARLSLGI